jgi:hypothetical protein
VLVAVAHERSAYGGAYGGGLLARMGAPAKLSLRELPGRRAPRTGQVIAMAPRSRLDVWGSSAQRVGSMCAGAQRPAGAPLARAAKR